MARPKKEGLEYFSLDVDMDQDDKIALIESQHGLVGFSIVIKLFMKIYGNGYYYEWGEKEQLLFSKRVNVDINTLSTIINDCIKWEIFDNNLFEKYEILTSKGIQKRFLLAVGRRQKVEINEKYLLLSLEDISVYKNLVIVNNNTYSEGVNVDIGTQREIEREIEIESKEKEVITLPQDNKSNDKAIELCDYYSKLKPGQSISKELPTLIMWIEMYGYEWTKEAMQMCISKKNIFIKPWIEKVLKSWRAEGHTTQSKASNTSVIDDGTVKIGSRVYDYEKLEKGLLGRNDKESKGGG